ncbi:DNA replication/checkpoint protein [Calycina marina]|uniref:DNA replication regulator SLD2 n=1 Tax=Calycina marina TaxID=1763456 RepID=A0A9P8CGX5_9HELO|nr:DNA replication/checkpoint protein [Calycina marina]
MDDIEKEEWTKRSSVLKLELKAWEKEFAAANDGHKASRDDIKKNPVIAQKYKDYNSSRDILSGKIILPPQASFSLTPRKRKREDDEAHKSTKLQKPNDIMKTPSKIQLDPWEVDPYESPNVVRNLFTPRKMVLGPTPQKDGQVLGLFDLIPDESMTPGKSPQVPGAQKYINATPRRSGNLADASKHDRTPGSTGKRFMRDKFSTPSKNRLQLAGQGRSTPSSVSKLHFATPSFLRRDRNQTLPVVDENNLSPELSPQMVRQSRKPLVRGLSSILAGLRKIEEDAADEDLEALREMEAMENEMVGGGARAPKSVVNPSPKPVPPVEEDKILLKDSQQELLGGFDDEAMFDSDPEEVKIPTLGRDGQPLKTYKKKGQKRTTRRFKMKPSRSKPENNTRVPADEDSGDELGQDDELVPEIQVIDDTPEFNDARNYASDTQSEYTASEGGTRYRRPDQSKKAKRITKDGKIRTSTKKVTSMTSQNFKRLKLRNTGSKGGPAHNSKFRRKKK